MEFFKPDSYTSIPTQDIISWIFDNPTYDQDRPVYIDAKNPSSSISCNQARKLIRQIIAGLRAAGFQKGDCLNIHSFNDIYYSIVFLAIIGAGGVFSGTNPAYTQAELAHHLKTARVKFLISEPEILGNLTAAAKDCNIPSSNIWIFDTQDQPIASGFRSWKELTKYGEEDWVRFNDENACDDTTAARLFSSGTTGLPKAAMISHKNLIAQHTLVFETKPSPHEISRIVAIPCFHAAAVPATHVSALKAGHALYVMRRFDLELFLQSMEKYNITDVTAVPPMALAIVKSPLSKLPYLKKAKCGAAGAAPLDKDVQAKFQSLMSDGATFTQVWGMTESSCIATMFFYPENDLTGSVGRQIPNLEIKLIDDSGNNVSAYDVRGEMCIRGPTVIKGYFDNPKANAESFDKDGWFKTGDIGYCDGKTRKWYLVDRKKELIKVRGFQVAPPEIEAVLLSHPHIMDAAIIGVTFPGENQDDKEIIEHPRAFVVRQPVPESKSLTEKSVQQFAASKLAKYKYISGGVVFVDAIPKNASGKILKRVLRDQSKKEIKAGLRPRL